ncbi:MAG: hypothetical protein IPL99_12005 [Candidatus Competibacteraceae bacterium]|nr:hypothetical protein [Candidatus Competibacteraceae bacterium]
MNARILPVLALWLLVGCTDHDVFEPLEPIYSPPSALLIQQAQAGDAAAQFALADAHQGDNDPAVMIYGRRQSAQQNHAPAVVRVGRLSGRCKSR